MSAVTVTRIGKKIPGIRERTFVYRARLDPVPIVLWGKDGPAAILSLRVRTNLVTGSATVAILRADGGSGPGAFPIETKGTISEKTPAERDLDIFDMKRITTADVNGDGVDELVVPFQLGAVEVYGVRGQPLRLEGPSTRPGIVCYEPRSIFTAHLKGRDVVYVLLERRISAKDVSRADLEKAGALDPFAVVRVDERGPARVAIRMQGWVPGRVLAVGALSRKGSQGVDELLLLGTPGGSDDVVLSRHRPDGAPLGPPRRVVVPFVWSYQARFAFLPGSDRTVLLHHEVGQAFVVAPDKPANWFHPVPLAGLPGEPYLLGAKDGETPKVIVSAGDGVFAVGEDGATFVSRGTGWARSAGPGPVPFLRTDAPSPIDWCVGVFPAERDPTEILVVHSRAREPRELSREELVAAAERFLPPEEMAEHRALLSMDPNKPNSVRGEIMEEEARAKKIDRKITSEAEWKALLPHSYAQVAEMNESMFVSGLRARLITAREGGDVPEEFRDPDGFRAWRAGLDASPRTSFALSRRGTRVVAFEIEGDVPKLDVVLRGTPFVPFRSWGDTVQAVLTLTVKGASGRDEAGFVLVRAAGGGR
jgi:hypothetical protein